MSDDTFRMVVMAAVVLAGIALLVQAGVAIALYRAVRKMLEKVDLLVDRAGPLIAKLGPVIDQVGPLVEEAVPAFEKAGPAIEKAGPVIERAGAILQNVQKILEETRPRVSEFCTEAAAAAKSGRQQVERIGSLLNDASERARTRLEQIDHSVESTVEQVEQVSDAVKRAAMRPVREVNGIAAGISAVVSTLVKGPHKSSVDHATQDEEMFI